MCQHQAYPTPFQDRFFYGGGKPEVEVRWVLSLVALAVDLTK
jgi:hypothetical protein